jgi:hypothetical protein
MKKINSPLRVKEVGGMSYWPSNMDAAKQMIDVIISHNGCGVVEARQPDGLWKLTHRFEPHTGIVAAYKRGVEDATKPAYTTGHCKNKSQPGGCQLHNLQCGYPDCDRKES